MRNLFDETYSQFINIAPKNWTQTNLTRFVKMPNTGYKLESNFIKSKNEFNSIFKDSLGEL